MIFDRRPPEYLKCILSFWYSNQKYAIRWDSVISSYYGVSNDIRQTGLISRLLYKVYTHTMGTWRKNTQIGCHIAGDCVNLIFNAYCMVLLAPSLKTLQALIDVCYISAIENGISYDGNRTHCMTLWPRLCTRTGNIPALTNIFVDNVVYLGHVLNTNLMENSKIYKQVWKQNTVGTVLVRKFAICTDEVNWELFRAHCFSLYCLESLVVAVLEQPLLKGVRTT